MTIEIIDQTTSQTLTIEKYTPWQDVQDQLLAWFPEAPTEVAEAVETFARAITDLVDGGHMTTEGMEAASFLALDFHQA